jgi:hypothetical protein
MKKTGEEVVVVPLVGTLTKEQAAEINQAIEDKNHASYLCYMLLRRLDNVVPLKALLELAVKRGFCSDDVVPEFFDTEVNFILNGDGMTNVNPGISSKRSVGDGKWSFTMKPDAFKKWLKKHTLSLDCSDNEIVGDDGHVYGTVPDYEEAGCSEAEGHTIPSLLAMWQERTDKMMELMKVGR